MGLDHQQRGPEAPAATAESDIHVSRSGVPRVSSLSSVLHTLSAMYAPCLSDCHSLTLMTSHSWW